MYAGGIVGAFGFRGVRATTVERCFNVGEITGVGWYRKSMSVRALGMFL